MLKLYISAFSGLDKKIWVLSGITLVNRTGSMVILFTSLFLTKELGFSLSDAGLLMSFYGMGSILGSFLGGWLTDRFSYYNIMLASLLSSGLTLLLILGAKQFWAIGLILFFYALLSDVFRPAMSASIAAYTSPENRTRSVSLVRLAINLGFSIGPAIGGFVAKFFGYFWLFLADSLTSLTAAGLMLLFLPRPKVVSVQHASNFTEKEARGKSAYKDGIYLFFIFLVALYAIGFFQIFASLPQFFNRNCHYSEDIIGLLMALNGALVVIIEMPLITWLQQKNKKSFQLIALGVICIPLSFLILLFFPCAIWMAIAFIFVITLSEVFAMPFMMNFSLTRPGMRRQGEYSALYSIAYGIANMVAPSIGLWIADHFGFESLFLGLVLFFIPVALVFRKMEEWTKT